MQGSKEEPTVTGETTDYEIVHKKSGSILRLCGVSEGYYHNLWMRVTCADCLKLKPYWGQARFIVTPPRHFKRFKMRKRGPVKRDP